MNDQLDLYSRELKSTLLAEQAVYWLGTVMMVIVLSISSHGISSQRLHSIAHHQNVYDFMWGLHSKAMHDQQSMPLQYFPTSFMVWVWSLLDKLLHKLQSFAVLLTLVFVLCILGNFKLRLNHHADHPSLLSCIDLSEDVSGAVNVTELDTEWWGECWFLPHQHYHNIMGGFWTSPLAVSHNINWLVSWDAMSIAPQYVVSTVGVKEGVWAPDN